MRPQPRAPSARRARLRQAEAWLWTGPLGHLVGGALDLTGAFARYWWARLRRRAR